MKRYLPLVLIFMVSCGQPGVLLWVSPTPNTTVGGSVVLQVDAPGGEVDNVVFSVNGEFIAKSYDMSAVWNTSNLPSGVYTLEAKPFGLPTSYAKVRVSNVSTGEPAAPKGSDPLGLGPLLKVDPAPFLAFARSVPPGIDLREIFAQPDALRVQQALEPDLLPRGVYAYDELLEDWIMTPGGDDFLLTFSYSDETGLEHLVEARVTYGATRTINDQEVPEALFLRVTDNERLLLSTHADASYRDLPGCGVVLEPETLNVVGSYASVASGVVQDPPTGGAGDVQGPTPVQDVAFSLHYLAADEEGNSVLNTRVDVAAGRVAMYGLVDVRALLTFVRDGCLLSDIEPTEVLPSLDVGYMRGDKPTGVRLALDLSSIVRSPLAAQMVGSLSLYKDRDEEVTAFSGELSDPNRDGVPGEKAVALSPNGIRRPLDRYLKNLWNVYLERLGVTQ